VTTKAVQQNKLIMNILCSEGGLMLRIPDARRKGISYLKNCRFTSAANLLCSDCACGPWFQERRF
jgi:hypothetical protein